MAEGDTARHAGNWLMNCCSVGIEVVSAGEDYSEVEAGKRRLGSNYAAVQPRVNQMLS